MFTHRFVEIHQACALAEDNDMDTLWSTLAQKPLPTIAVSNACQRIVNAVQANKLQFQDALVQMQNLVLTCTNQLNISIFLQTITKLLQWYMRQPTLQQSVPLNLIPTPHRTLHPFIAITRHQPSLYFDVLQQVHALFDDTSAEDEEQDCNVFDTLKPFFDAVLLLGLEGAMPSALLSQLKHACYLGFREEILDYITNTITRFPTQRQLHLFMELVEFAIDLLLEPDGHIQKTVDIRATAATRLFYRLLCHACNAAAYGRPTLPYIQAACQLYYAQDWCTEEPMVQSECHIVWGCLSFLLATAQTVDDQELILQLLRSLARNDLPEAHVRLIALMPLFQTLSEIPDKTPSNALKSTTIELISMVVRDTIPLQETDRTTVTTKIRDVATKYCIGGVLAHMIPLFDTLYHPTLSEATPKDDTTFIFALLFSTPHMCSEVKTVRHHYLSSMAQLTFTKTTQGVSFRFPVILVLLNIMKHQDIMPTDTLLHLFHNVFPSLTDPDDPVTTTKLLQLTLSMIYGPDQHTNHRDTALACLGFKLLVKMYERQPRIWQEVKKIMANWIIQRKSATNWSSFNSKSSVQMELSVLTSMRDLCRDSPRECAQDILPMLMSLLQSCTNLSVSSLTIIVQAICACVTAGLAEPRSIWTVAISYIAQYAMNHPVTIMSPLLCALSSFWAIVGDKDEVSEIYMDFKEAVLNNYVIPLAESEHKPVRTAALEALSHFPATDIARFIPEKAKEYTAEITDAPNPSHVHVLVKLIARELDHMQRGLFIEEAAPVKEKTKEHDSANLIGVREHQMGNQFVVDWEQARTAPGLRAGYAMAVLHAASSHMTERQSTASTMNKTKWYRCIGTSIADIGLTDHLLMRVACLGGWVSLFGTALESNKETLEEKAQQLLKDLLARLDKSTVPGTTCNIMLAISGLVTAVYQLMPAAGTLFASQILDLLCTRYIVAAGAHVSSNATLIMSEEVQFASYFILGHLSSCAITNEKITGETLRILVEGATDQQQASYRPLDTAVSLVEFAQGYAAGHFTAALFSWPTASPAIKSMAENARHVLIDHCKNASQASESRMLGLLMGWASQIQQQNMKDVYEFASDVLKSYVQGNGVTNKGVILGSMWVCSYGVAGEDDKIDDMGANVLESAAAMASEDERMSLHQYHFAVPLAMLSRTRLLVSEADDENSTTYRHMLAGAYNELDTANAVKDRITHLLALGTLLGADYLNRQDNDRLLQAAHKYDPRARQLALDMLGSMAGLAGDDVPPVMGNLKSNRIAAFVCGKVIQATTAMRDSKKMERASTSRASVSNAMHLNEAKSYARLNNNTSYLRAVFDGLTGLNSKSPNPNDIGMIELFLDVLTQTQGPLPPVNWFPLLTDLSTLSDTIQMKCITFAGLHSNTSMSLSEFIISQIQNTKVSPDVQVLLMSEAAFGQILTQSGLPNLRPTQRAAGPKRRGMDAVTKKATISTLRCVEIYEHHAKGFRNMPVDVQLVFLTTLSNHLPPATKTEEDENKAMLIRTLREITWFNITIYLLESKSLSTKEAKYVDVVTKAAECGITDLGQLKEAHSDQTDTLVEMTMMTTLCSLGYANTAVQWIVEKTRSLIDGLVNDPAVWNQWVKAIQLSTEMNIPQKLAWILRLLDTFIVVAGNSAHHENCAGITQGVAMGLWRVLLVFWWWSGPASYTTQELPNSVTCLDTEYMLTHVIHVAQQHSVEQKQIMKRILQLVSLVHVDDKPSDSTLYQFLLQVLRGSPNEAVQPFEQEIARWL